MAQVSWVRRLNLSLLRFRKGQLNGRLESPAVLSSRRRFIRRPGIRGPGSTEPGRGEGPGLLEGESGVKRDSRARDDGSGDAEVSENTIELLGQGVRDGPGGCGAGGLENKRIVSNTNGVNGVETRLTFDRGLQTGGKRLCQGCGQLTGGLVASPAQVHVRLQQFHSNRPGWRCLISSCISSRSTHEVDGRTAAS
jgi:hypothetical protein